MEALTPYTFTVSIYDAHLEFLVDGDGDWFATLEGVVSQSNHDAIHDDLQIEVRYGNYDPSIWGLVIGPNLAGATLARGQHQIDSLKALLDKVRPDGPSLKVDFKLKGEPELRANGRVRDWSMVNATASLSSTAQIAPPDYVLGADFDAELRVEIAPKSVDTLKGGGPMVFTGAIAVSKLDAIGEGLPIQLSFEPDAEREFIFDNGSIRVRWPLSGPDERSMLDILERIGDRPLLIDLDMGHQPNNDDPRQWFVTDVTMIASSVLCSHQAGEN